MATFVNFDPKSEKELHGIIEKDLDLLEDGLILLKYEMNVGSGIPDFLCVDSGGRLVIIEVKAQEDENILFQALRYYAVINKKRYIIANIFSQHNVNPKLTPRIILIAKRFSDDIRVLGTLVVPDIELYGYNTLIDSVKVPGIVYHPVLLPKVEESIANPLSVEDHREYITKENLKPIFDKIREQVQGIHSTIEEYVTQSYVGYKFKGRQLSWVTAHRKSFDFGTNIVNEKGEILDYKSVRIQTGNEDYAEVFEKIKELFKSLGGNLI